MTWWKLCYQLFSPNLFYLTQNRTNRRLRLAFIRRVQERTKNTEISSDGKLTVSPVSFAKLTAQGAPALLAVSFQFVWNATLPSGMIDEDRINYRLLSEDRWSVNYTLHGGDSATGV